MKPNRTCFLHSPACFGNLNDDIRDWFYASVGSSYFNLLGVQIVRSFRVPIKNRNLKLTDEEQVISKRFLELSMVLFDSHLTDDMVRRSGLYSMSEAERALLTERHAAKMVARVVAVEGEDIVIDRKVSFGVTDLNAHVRSVTGPSSRKRKVLKPISPSKRLFLPFDHVSNKKRLVDFVHRSSIYSNSADRDASREDHCSRHEAEEMKLAVERSEKDIVCLLDGKEKKLLFAYGSLDAVKCSYENPQSLDD